MEQDRQENAATKTARRRREGVKGLKRAWDLSGFMGGGVLGVSGELLWRGRGAQSMTSRPMGISPPCARS